MNRSDQIDFLKATIMSAIDCFQEFDDEHEIDNSLTDGSNLNTIIYVVDGKRIKVEMTEML